MGHSHVGIPVHRQKYYFEQVVVSSLPRWFSCVAEKSIAAIVRTPAYPYRKVAYWTERCFLGWFHPIFHWFWGSPLPQVRCLRFDSEYHALLELYFSIDLIQQCSLCSFSKGHPSKVEFEVKMTILASKWVRINIPFQCQWGGVLSAFWFIIARFLAQNDLCSFEWCITGVYPQQRGRLEHVFQNADWFINNVTD